MNIPLPSISRHVCVYVCVVRLLGATEPAALSKNLRQEDQFF